MSKDQKTFFLIAGEPSGDALGAALIRALKHESAEAPRFIGVGGPLMEAEGFSSLIPMEEICVMGLWEVVGHLPRLLKLIDGMVHEIEQAKPDAVITIDLQDFNYQVASRLKKRGNLTKTKMIQYVAPTVWAWRPGRAKKMAAVFDRLLCLFPFEPDYFKPHGLNATFTGHSLIERKLEDADGKRFREQRNIAPTDTLLGLFLGSRESELSAMSAVMKDTASVMAERNPGLKIVVPTLPILEFEVRKLMEGWNQEVIVVADPEKKWDACAACDIGLAVSGTMGLELAWLGIPHVIAYRMHPLTWLIVQRMVKVKQAHLANILLKETIVPEFLQKNCDALLISKELIRILQKPERRKKQIEGFSRLREALGAGLPEPPSVMAARAVLET